jgi:hypothetical protein
MNAVRGVRGWILAVTLAAGSVTCSGDVTGPKPEPEVLERVAGHVWPRKRGRGVCSRPDN